MSAGPERERDGFGFRGDAMLFLKSFRGEIYSGAVVLLRYRTVDQSPSR